jgi:putative PIG3 family NAD(P)H quinone oxidoreductase
VRSLRGVFAVTMSGPGDEDVLQWERVADPAPADGEVVVDVVATAVNRADLLQRMGFYPPPPGASELLGLEASGRVSAVGSGVDRWQVGDEVCALLAGGGYAERVAVPAGQCMPVPAGIALADAAALPEVACTVWSNLVLVAGLAAGDALLVHGGASGIGTMAIQVGKALGASPIIATARAEKHAICRELGADVVVDYTTDDFVEAVRAATGGRGADVVLDIMGAAYLERNVETLAPDGRLVVIGMQGGTRAELDLNALLRKRASLHATTLRSRPSEQKARICAAVERDVWPLVQSGQVRPVIGERFPISDVAAAHRLVADSGHVGKVLLLVR